MWGGGDGGMPGMPGMPGMMGMMGMMGGGGGGNPLVERVKDWQRKSQGHRKAWETWCQMNGETKFDPSRKDPSFLKAFCDAADAGQVPVIEEDQFELRQKEPLVQGVKKWQRKGQGHKQAWWTFCSQHGSADYDPNRHEIAFLQTFLHDCENGTIVPEEVTEDGGEGMGCGKGGKPAKGKGKGKGKGGDAGQWGAFMKGMFQVWLMKGKGMAAGADGGGDGGADAFGAGAFGAGGGAAGGQLALTGGEGPLIGEVRYNEAGHAYDAGAMLDGSEINGSTISIKLDPKSQDGTKLIVENIPAGLEWQELKDHFAQVGPVAYAGIRGKDIPAKQSWQNWGGGGDGGAGMGSGGDGGLAGMFGPMMGAMMGGKGKGKGASSMGLPGYTPY